MSPQNERLSEESLKEMVAKAEKLEQVAPQIGIVGSAEQAIPLASVRDAG